MGVMLSRVLSAAASRELSRSSSWDGDGTDDFPDAVTVSPAATAAAAIPLVGVGAVAVGEVVVGVAVAPAGGEPLLLGIT